MKRVVGLMVLVLSSLVLIGCDPVQQAWIDNESDADVVVTVDDEPAVRVPAGASGIAYGTIGTSSQGRQVAVLTADCALLAQTNTPANTAWLLRITVRSGGGVVFDHGASMSSLTQRGTVSPTAIC